MVPSSPVVRAHTGGTSQRLQGHTLSISVHVHTLLSQEGRKFLAFKAKAAKASRKNQWVSQGEFIQAPDVRVKTIEAALYTALAKEHRLTFLNKLSTGNNNLRLNSQICHVVGALSNADVDQQTTDLKNCVVGVQFIEDKLFDGLKLAQVHPQSTLSVCYLGRRYAKFVRRSGPMPILNWSLHICLFIA
jgi:hypothetical protein